MLQQRRQRIYVLLFLLALWALIAYGTYLLLAVPRLQAFDFYPRWHGARIMLTGENPYTLAVNLEILEAMRSPTEPPDHNFFYPATITYILLPFWLLPWTISISLWSSLTLLLAIALPMVVLRMIPRRVSAVQLGVLTFFSIFVFRHPLITYSLGQFTVWVLACLILAIFATKKELSTIQALALIGATIRPEGIIFTAFVLLELLIQRKYSTLLIWSGVMGSILTLSVIQAGFWIPDFVGVVSAYDQCCVYVDVAASLGIWRYPFTFATLGWFGWLWWDTRTEEPQRRLLWRISAFIVLILLVVVQSKDYTLVYVLLPLWFVVGLGGRWRDIVLVCVLMGLPWLFFETETKLGGTLPLEPLIIPLLAGLLLTLYRLGIVSSLRNVSPA